MTQVELYATEPLIADIGKLCAEGRFLDALNRGKILGPVQNWRGAGAEAVAAKLAFHLGAPSLAEKIDLMAYRRNRKSYENTANYLFVVLGRRGPYDAYLALKKALNSQLDGDRFALVHAQVTILSEMRDFLAAEALLSAQQLPQEKAWYYSLWASLYELQDKTELAVEMLHKGLGLFPNEPRLEWALGRLLAFLSNFDESLCHLSRASNETQSAWFALRYAGLLNEMGHYEEALCAIDRAESLSVLADDITRTEIASMRADIAYSMGDIAKSIAEAKKSKLPWLIKVAERIEKNATGRKVLLDVPYIRQHHKTCAPATLTAISQYWSRTAEHLEIVEEICYDGTPCHNERKWAVEHGWAVAEFSVTWADSVMLLNLGVPFTLATVEPHGAHLQAVVGYDEKRGTLFIRDPGVPSIVEADAEALIARYRSVGLRGMALVPQEKQSLLENLSLTDAYARQLLHEVLVALAENNRAGAAELLAQLLQNNAPSDIIFRAKTALASYDRDPVAALSAANDMLRQFPDDTMAQLVALHCQRDLASRKQRTQWLESIIAGQKVHPLFLEELATELLNEPNEHERCAMLLRRVCRMLPGRGRTYYLLAELLRTNGEPLLAAELIRFACCLEVTNEEIAARAFSVSKPVGQADSVLELLRWRKNKLGSRSPASIVTLCWALEDSGQQRLAMVELENALILHPNDANLLLSSARWFGSSGLVDRANELLLRAEKIAKRAEWLDVAAFLAMRSGQLSQAVTLLEELVALQPLVEASLVHYLTLLELTQGLSSPRDFVKSLYERFADNTMIGRLFLSAERVRCADAYEKALNDYIEKHSTDSWAYFERANLYSSQYRLEEAKIALEAGARGDSRSAAYLDCHATLCSALGDTSQATELLLKKVSLQPDDSSTLTKLCSLQTSLVELGKLWEHVGSILLDLCLRGQSVRHWYLVAKGVFTDELLETWTKRLFEKRVDLTQSWWCRIEWLLTSFRYEEAKQLIERGQSDFPIEPVFAQLLADLIEKTDGFEAALPYRQKAFALSPELFEAADKLATCFREMGDLQNACDTLHKALCVNPGEPYLVISYAQNLEEMGNRQKAIGLVTDLLTLNPGVSEGWQYLEHAFGESRSMLVLFAKSLVEKYPDYLSPKHYLSMVYANQQEWESAIETLDSALALSKHELMLHEKKIEMLHRAGRSHMALKWADSRFESTIMPPGVAGRLIAIEYDRGEVVSAIDKMKDIVFKHSDFYWGWRQLFDWYSETDDPRGAFGAARVLSAMVPNASYGHFQLAQTLSLSNHKSEAILHYRLANRLDSARLEALFYGGMAAIDLGDLSCAEQMIQAYDEYYRRQKEAHQDLNLLNLKLRYSAATRDTALCKKWFGAICQDSSRQMGPILYGRKLLLQAGLSNLAHEVLFETCGVQKNTSGLIELWIKGERIRGTWSLKRLDSLRKNTVLFGSALNAELRNVGDIGLRARFKKLTHMFWEDIKNNDILLAEYGVVSWQTKGVWHAIWSLQYQPNSSFSRWRWLGLRAKLLRYWGVTQRASLLDESVLEQARLYSSRDDNERYVVESKVWSAYDLALVGEYQPSMAALRSVNPKSLGPLGRAIYGLAHQMVVFAQTALQMNQVPNDEAQPEELGHTFEQAWAQLWGQKDLQSVRALAYGDRQLYEVAYDCVIGRCLPMLSAKRRIRLLLGKYQTTVVVWLVVLCFMSVLWYDHSLRPVIVLGLLLGMVFTLRERILRRI